MFAVAAAFSNGVNVLTQHRASIGAPGREKGWHLVGYLFRQPLWLLGWIAAVGGFVFQALALHRGQLSVVQPLLITELVFVLVLRRVWIHRRALHRQPGAGHDRRRVLRRHGRRGGHAVPHRAAGRHAVRACGGRAR